MTNRILPGISDFKIPAGQLVTLRCFIATSGFLPLLPRKIICMGLTPRRLARLVLVSFQRFLRLARAQVQAVKRKLLA